jgi:hypothetical protein
VAYYIKNMLKIDLKTVRTENGTVYMTPEHHAVYLERLKKEAEQKKAAADAAKADVKAEANPLPPPPCLLNKYKGFLPKPEQLSVLGRSVCRTGTIRQKCPGFKADHQDHHVRITQIF